MVSVRLRVLACVLFTSFLSFYSVAFAELPVPVRLWNLQNADIRGVLQSISDLTGKNFVVDPRVQGRITLVSAQPMSADAMYQVFLSMLRVLNYVAVDEGAITKIIPAGDAKGTVKVVPLAHVDAARVSQVIQSLQAANHGHDAIDNAAVVAGPNPHTVLVSGSEASQAAAMDLIRELDVVNFQTDLPHSARQVVRLNYLTASKIAPMLTKLAAGYAEQEKNKISGVPFSRESRIADFSVQAVDDENAIVMHGSEEMMQNLQAVIAQIDTRPQEVLVQAIIVRVDETALSQLGVQWGTGDPANQGDNSGLAVLSRAFTNGVGYIRNGSFGAIVHALSSNANTDVLATPSVLVLNNHKAVISDGKNVGIYDKAYSSSNVNEPSGDEEETIVPYNTYDRKDVTLSLIVTPQIAPDNTVKLLINQKDDSLAPDAKNKDPNNPTINTSHIDTTVLVNSGDILVLGGLISHNETEIEQKIPILGSIPFLKRLFTDKQQTKERKNLFVFIRPMIINNKIDADKQSLKPYEYIRYQQMRKQNGMSLVNDTKHPMLPEASYAAQNLNTIKLPVPFGNVMGHSQ